MKKIIFSFLALIITTGLINAQYSINKTKYDYRNFQFQPGDPYNPGLCSGINLLIPGLGQMIAGEGGRGAAFLGGYIGCVVIYAVGSVQAVVALDDELYGGPAYSGEGLPAMIIGVGGMITVLVWSIVDGGRVAKVNNLAWRDKNNTGYNMKLEPYIAPLQTYGSNNLQGGISLKLSF